MHTTIDDLPSEMIVLISSVIETPVDWFSFGMCSKMLYQCSITDNQVEIRKAQAARRLQEKIFAPVFALFNEVLAGWENTKTKRMVLYSKVYNIYVMHSTYPSYTPPKYPLPFDKACISHFNTHQNPIYESISFILGRIEEQQPIIQSYLNHIFMYMITVSKKDKYLNYMTNRSNGSASDVTE